jgi:hypothetical protein
MKKKINWTDVKERVVNALKFTIFIVTGLMGFWVSYCILWNIIGLPTSTPAMWVMFGQAVVSEILFMRWLSN